MSGDGRNLFGRGEEFLALFKRGADFYKELLQENERLRHKLMQMETEQTTAAQNPEDWDKLRIELLNRIHTLEHENRNFRERLTEVEAENHQFATRYVEIEEENNNLANLYVASYQLHSTVDLDEVLQIIIEIVINLIGAEAFAVYVVDEHTRELVPVKAEGRELSRFPRVQLGVGPLGAAAFEKQATTWEAEAGEDREHPLVCIPLVVQETPIGAIGIYSLLQQKEGFSALDRELFNLLGGHAATALFAARLYSQSKRKLNTIQGFIDLLTQ